MKHSDASGESEESGELAFALMHASQAIEDRVEAALGRAGLSLAKFGVLTELVRANQALTLSELASRLSCVRSNMTQLIDRLEADGLVERVDDPADRRAVRAALTESGKAQQAAGDREMKDVHRYLAALLSTGDRSHLNRILSALG
jgi:DNA-binding MarR family transcriptional regulator